MKTLERNLVAGRVMVLSLLFMMVATYANAQIFDKNRADLNKPETEIQAEIIWNVKAYHPVVQLIKVKAIDKDGNIHDVKAIQDSYDTSILDVKALVNGKRLPVKLIIKESDLYYPLKAIDDDGTLIDIKAITEDGKILDIKGIGRAGNIVHVRAIAANATFYNIVAVSPEGKMNTVKGVKMMTARVETVINGVSIFAHVKALKQD